MEKKIRTQHKKKKIHIKKKVRKFIKRIKKRFRHIKKNIKHTKNKPLVIALGCVSLVAVVALGFLISTKVKDANAHRAVMHQLEMARQEREELEAIRAEEERLAKEAEQKAIRERIEVANGLQQAWENLWLKEVDIPTDNTQSFMTIEQCVINPEDTTKVHVEGMLPGIPKSDSDDIYLFAMNNYETSIVDGAEPIISYRIEKTQKKYAFDVNLNYNSASSRLFKKFVVAAKKNGKYVILTKSRFITNPEAIASTNTYVKASSKKGLWVDPNRLNTGELEDLGVKQAAYNIPIGYIMGPTSSANFPTIYYDYNGVTYAFNGQSIAEFDIVFGSLSRKGLNVTAVLLNSNNGNYPQIVHPQARGGSSAPYRMFNGSDESGVNCIAAVATFLAKRYSGSHGTISNWVIANEINARKEWNYMEYTDVNTYTQAYAQGFRVFYNAIKSVNGAANVYMPLDQTWDRNRTQDMDYDAKDVLDVFNGYIKEHGNIDWHLAHHPYPVPLTNAAFWNTGGYYQKLTTNSVSTPMICMKNINVVTDYLQREEMLTDSGEIRSVLLSEVGFTSSSGGEAVQSAAYAYAYYITEANSHIDGLILNRQTDAPEEVAQGLAFGLNNSGGGRKHIYNVFKHIDTGDSKATTEFAKGILGISDWSSVIHNY